MFAYQIDGAFGLENLKKVERAKPTAGPGEVVVKMKAASLNYRDLLVVLGHYNPRQPLPVIPCSDGSGVVVEVGDGVSSVAVDDRVCPLFCQSWVEGNPTKNDLRDTLGSPIDGVLAGHAGRVNHLFDWSECGLEDATGESHR